MSDLAAAIEAARSAPSDRTMWDNLEELAATAQTPDEVANLYAEALQTELGAELTSELGQRAVQWIGEWYGDDAELLVQVLERVIEVDPEASWAFQRLTMALTTTGKFDDLLALYDRTLASSNDEQLKASLLEEAANAARDLASDAHRAIGYLKQLALLRPTDRQLASSLERLMEREGAWQDLIDLWNERLPSLTSKAEILAARRRIARATLDKLNQPEQALAEVQALIEAGGKGDEVLKLLEAISSSEAAEDATRRESLALLKQRYVAEGRGTDVVRTLDSALELAGTDEAIHLHREAGQRLASQERFEEALGHFAELLRLDPSARDALERLRELCKRLELHDQFVAALEAAAEEAEPIIRVALRLEAADVRRTSVDDVEGAILLYRQVLAEGDVAPASTLKAARRLNMLLGAEGRPEERLDILEQLARTEPEAADRRAAVGQAARVAAELGDVDRSLATWARCLDENPQDLEALDATVALLEREERWEPLLDMLLQRASAPVPRLRRRADLVRVAEVQAAQLSQGAEAVETWRAIGEEFGEDTAMVDALSALLSDQGRWDEVSDLLRRAADREADHVATLYARIGDVQREHMANSSHAAEAYASALRVDPTHEEARSGLAELLDLPECMHAACEALALAYEATDEWQGEVGLLEYRLQCADSVHARVRLLRRAAVVHEERAEDKSSALSCVRRAMGFAPDQRDIEADVLRLAEETGEWEVAVHAVREAVDTLGDATPRARYLRFWEGKLCEQHLQDLDAAVSAYATVLGGDPERVDAAEAVIRCASRIGQWEQVAQAVVTSSAAHEGLDPAVTAAMEEAGSGMSGWSDAIAALEAAVATSELPPKVARDLEVTIAGWDQRFLDDPEAAQTALQRAIAHDNQHVETLERLAQLQRIDPDRPLYDTLMRLADLAEDNLDPLREATEVALDAMEDEALRTFALDRLYREASRFWKRDTQTTGRHNPEEASLWALERLVQAYERDGAHDRSVAVLADAGHLPMEPAASRALRRRAASIAASHGDRPRAIVLYRTVLDEMPEDTEALRQLAEVCEAEGSLPEMLSLRRRELVLVTDPDRRLAIRLDIARVASELEAGREEALKANLQERPGHEESIAALSAVLESRRRYDELADVLGDQATKLEADGDIRQAAVLWARVATLCEQHLDDLERALTAHRRVVEMSATEGALDALARLHTDRGEHAAAAQWLERRLAQADATDRTDIALRLAGAHLGAGQPERAVTCLETALAEAPDRADVREMLAARYREAGADEPLAELLTAATAHVHDGETLLAYAREASTLFEQLGAPERAMPVLEKASELASDDHDIRGRLATALSAAGRHEEAATLLTEVIESFGRRRSGERGKVHHQLAMVARAQGDLDKALEQLDLASKMDVSNPRVLRMLGRLAHEAEQFERAERSYRALLLIVRRKKPGERRLVGAAEVLFELHRIAQARDDSSQADELLESSLDAARKDDEEVELLARLLLEQGEPELALKALEGRLAAVEAPTARATLLTRTATLLDEHLSRSEDALARALEAVSLAPAEATIHKQARALATKLGQTQPYVDAVQALIDEGPEQEELSQLLLSLGRAVEQDLGELDRAAQLFRRVETLGHKRTEAWAALARIAQARGDADEEVRVLDLWIGVEDPSVPQVARIDGMFRLAEVRLASPAHVDAGVDMLRRALALDPRSEQAGAILQKAAADHAGHEGVLELYERVARGSGDPELLLDFLKRRALRPDARLGEIREAVELATAEESFALAEHLLERAATMAREHEDGLAGALWVAMGLAQRRKAAGDMAGAMEWMQEAAAAADEESAFAMWIDAARMAAEGDDDLAMAAEIYRRLLAEDPSDQRVWHPLLGVLRRQGDEDALTDLAATVIDGLIDPETRNLVRMERAQFYLDQEGREQDAADCLRDVLGDTPDNADAARMLADLYERTGYDEDLVDLLRNQLGVAREADDFDSVKETTMRLGALLEKVRREDAVDVYRDALESIPEDRDVAHALLQLLDEDEDRRERIHVMERLLATDTGANAAKLSRSIADQWEALGDFDGVQRALELGYRGCPEDAEIRDRLRGCYEERQNWKALAQFLAAEADRVDDPSESVEFLRTSAALYRDTLEDPGRAAAMLETARGFAPDDVVLLADLLRCRAAGGDTSTALAEVNEALQEHEGGKARVAMLRLRAELRLSVGQDESALRDLEEAFDLGGEEVVPDLVTGLRRRQQSLIDGSDLAAERDVMLRLARVLAASSQGDDAREVLVNWIGRVDGDVEALVMLRDVDEAGERWEDMARVCALLVEIESDAEQLDAAMRLADACERAGSLASAREGVEFAYNAQPEVADLRLRLREIYVAAEAHYELGQMLLEDAQGTEEEEDQYELFRSAGEHFMQAGDPDSALAALDDAVRIKPDDHETSILLVDGYIAAERFQDAGDMLERAIAAHTRRRSPELSDLQHRMARLAESSGDSDLQMQWLTAALDSHKGNGHVASELATLAMARGDHDVALNALRVVTLNKTEGPMSRAMAFLLQAKIAHERGEERRALLWARKAQSEDPALEEATEFLAQIGS